MKSTSFFVVYRPSENLSDPSMSFAYGLIASMTYEAFPSSALHALLAAHIIPREESSITSKSLGILGIVIFILFGKRNSKLPFIIIVDDDEQVLRAIQRDIRNKYRDEYMAFPSQPGLNV